MNLKQALNERLSKAKYIKRWKGADGRWKYLYKETSRNRKGLSDKDFVKEAYAVSPSAPFSSSGSSAAEKYVLYQAIKNGKNKLSDYSLYVDYKTAETLIVHGNKIPSNVKRFKKTEGFKLSDFDPYIVQWGKKNLTAFRTFRTEKGARRFADKKTGGKVTVGKTTDVLKE